MPVTRIKNNQITDLTVNAASKLQDFSITSGKIANNLTYNSSLTIAGNLTVQGNVTAIDTHDLVVEDPLIILAKDQTGSPTLDIGFIGERGDDINIAFVWKQNEGQFVTAFTNDLLTNTTITINSYANFQTNDITANNADLSGALDVTGNVTIANISIAGDSVIDAGNNVISNVAEPVANSDAATKAYVDETSASGFTIEDDVANTTIVSGGDTLELLGTADEVTVLITAPDQVTFGLPANVTIADNLTVISTANVTNLNASSNVSAGNAVITNNVSANTGAFTGNVSGATFLGNIDGATGAFTGNVSGATFLGNISGATGAFTGNVSGATFLGNISGATGAFTGNVTVDTLLGNIDGATGTFTGNVVAANLNANTNVTGTTITASGNLAGNNAVITNDVSAATGSFSGNVLAANLNANTNVTGTTISASGNVVAGGSVNANAISGNNIVITATSVDMQLTGNLLMSSRYINQLADPVQAYDAATKQYVDDAVSTGITIHTPVQLLALPPIGGTYAQGGDTYTVTDIVGNNTVVFSSAANLQVNDQLWFTNSFDGIVGNAAYFVVSAPNTSAAILTTTYNGQAISNLTNNAGLTQPVRVNSGQGATLTNDGALQALVIDSITTEVGFRVLLESQVNAEENGVYVVTVVGDAGNAWVLTRSSDMNTYIPDNINGLDAGDYFFVEQGANSAGQAHVMTAPVGPVVIGYNSLTFTQFSASSTYSANTQAGLTLNGTIFSAKVDNNTTAFDNGGNISVKANANLTTPNIGNATGNSLTLTGNGLLSATTVNATGNIVGNNITANNNVSTVTVTASGNVSGVNFLGNIDGATGTFSGNVTVDTLLGNIDGDTGTFSGNVTVDTLLGNIDGATGTFSGNVTVDTLLGNIDGDTGTFSGNVTVDTLLGNINGATGTFSGNVTVDTLLGNINGATGTFSGNVTANTFIGNVAGGNISGNISAGGSNTFVQFNDGGILNGVSGFTFNQATNQVTATGNVDAGNVNATNNVTANNVSVTNTISGNVVDASFANIANIRISGDNITSVNGIVTVNDAFADVDFVVNGESFANLVYVDAGSGAVVIGSGNVIADVLFRADSTDSIMVPVGNTDQRPAVGVTGMLRFNTSIDTLEYYDSDSWETVTTDFTVITANTQTGDGSTVAFTLPIAATTASTLVAINGVVQLPTTAYAVAGNVCTFTEAPEATDVIDFRILTTSTTVTGLAGDGGSSIELSPTVANIDFTGNLIPTANVTYDLGNATNAWNDLYLSGNTIFLGPLQLKAVNATEFGVFQADGTTTADLDVGNIDVAAIIQGNTVIGIASTNGNAYFTVGGTANVLVVSTAGANVTGTLGVTGNVTAGNLSGTNITGTLDTAAQTNITSVGTLTSLAVTGNVSGGNLITTGLISATGNVTAGNLSGTNITGTLDTAAQTNITSVGTLTSLAVTGNVSGGNLSTAGNVTGAVLKTANIFIDADVIHSANATLTIDPSAPGVTGLVVIAGNLQVQGTTTTIDSTTVTVNDLQFNVANNASTAAAANDAGLGVGPVGSEYAKWIYQNVGNVWSTAIGITASGNITGGNLITAGLVSLSSIIKTGSNGVGNIGSSTSVFNTVFAKATSAQYADLAEMYEADAAIEPGTVVAFGGVREVTVSFVSGDARVAGVISTNPSFIMNSALTGDHPVAVALTGRVPTRVTGTVRKGDMMVSAGDGTACACAAPQLGTVIGKALEDHDGVTGVIEVVVGRI